MLAQSCNNRRGRARRLWAEGPEPRLLFRQQGARLRLALLFLVQAGLGALLGWEEKSVALVAISVAISVKSPALSLSATQIAFSSLSVDLSHFW